MSEKLEGKCDDILPMNTGDTKDDYFKAYMKKKQECREIYANLEETGWTEKIYDDKYLDIVNASIQAKDSGDHSIFTMQVQNVDANHDNFWSFLGGQENI